MLPYSKTSHVHRATALYGDDPICQKERVINSSDSHGMELLKLRLHRAPASPAQILAISVEKKGVQ